MAGYPKRRLTFRSPTKAHRGLPKNGDGKEGKKHSDTVLQVFQRAVKGFKMLTLGWDDGVSFVPLDLEPVFTFV